ncbi:MAG: multidrug efflux SMR transporter [Halofilum sp. (in: g-proteobacteria)]
MAWFILLIAAAFEIVGAVGLKYTDGLTRAWPTAGALTSMTLGVILLGVAMKYLPVGTAYAVWTGIGVIGTVVLGIILFAEPATPTRLICLGLIVSGIIGLRLLEAS